MFIKGRKYGRLEVMQYFDPLVKNWRRNSYFSMKNGNEPVFLVFLNIPPSTKVYGKVFNYKNKFIDRENKVLLWESVTGDNLKKRKQLFEIYSNPSKVHVFVNIDDKPATKGKTDKYKYLGTPTVITQMKESSSTKEPSLLQLNFKSNADIIEDKIKNLADIQQAVLEGITPGRAEEIGYKAEFFVSEILDGKRDGIEVIEKKLGVSISKDSVKWMYWENKRADHDFEINNLNIEVKGSSMIKNKRIFMSANEMILAKKDPGKYFVFVVNDVDEKPNMEIYNWDEFNKEFEVKIETSYIARR